MDKKVLVIYIKHAMSRAGACSRRFVGTADLGCPFFIISIVKKVVKFDDMLFVCFFSRKSESTTKVV